jgi:hypothetical protein
MNRAAYRAHSNPHRADLKSRQSNPPPLRKISVTDAINWSDAVAWDRDLSPCAKALATVIRSCLDREKGFAFFSDEVVGMTRTGKSRRQLARARNELVASEYLDLWRPTPTSPWQYYPRLEKAFKSLSELKAIEASRREFRRRPQCAEDEIPF